MPEKISTNTAILANDFMMRYYIDKRVAEKQERKSLYAEAAIVFVCLLNKIGTRMR